MAPFFMPYRVPFDKAYEGAKKMANKEQKSNANAKKEPKLNLKEKRLAKQEKKSKKD